MAVAISSLQYSGAYGQTDDQALLDKYLVEIERLISENNLEAARDKLAEASSANLRDESLETIQGQLRLLENLNASTDSQPTSSSTAQPSSENSKLAAVDLLDWLRVADQRQRACCSQTCLLYTSPSPRDGLLSRMPSSA